MAWCEVLGQEAQTEALLSLNPMFDTSCKQRAELCCLILLISGGCYCSNTQPILTQIDNQLRQTYQEPTDLNEGLQKAIL